MKIFTVGRILIGVFMFWVAACATAPRTINPYFEMPPDHLLKAEWKLFALALQQQKSNKQEDSIDLWKRFLKNNPRSFRAYNNLGMAYYTNDQLLPAISAFETGLTLEPFDHKIKKNLKRTLRFKVTLLRENKDYDAAINFLKRIFELSKEPTREKVALEIETLEDLIFIQVKRSNTLENYETFLARYPNSPKNSEEARRQIARMKLQGFSTSELPTRKSNSSYSPSSVISESIAIESMETPKASMSDPIIREETIEIVAEPQLGGRSKIVQQVDEFPEGEPALDPEPMPIDETSVKEKIE
jgi:tetratricopeptide (TPR) repeat protein